MTPYRGGLQVFVAGLVAFVVPFAIYVASSPQSVGFWDTAEMQTVPYIFGIPHPSGCPAFIFSGWLVSHAVPLGSVAWRINVMCGAAMALAAWCVYATVVELEGKPWLGAFAAIVFGVGTVVWTHGSRAEVHALLIAFSALTLWLIVRWRRTGEDRALLGAALAYGFALATHGLAVLMAPGLAFLLFPRIREVPMRTLAHAAAHLALPLLLYLYIPLRSNYLYAHHVDPTLSLGLPPGRPFWDDQHVSTLGALLHYVAGSETHAGDALHSILDADNYGMVAAHFGSSVTHEFSFFGVVFALFGLVSLTRAQWQLALGLVAACLPSIPFGLLFAIDPERYFLAAFWLAAVLTAVGIQRVAVWCFHPSDALVDGIALTVSASLAFVLFVTNVSNFENRNNNSATEFVDRVVGRTPSNAILVANWTLGTSFGYAAYVERRLGNRIIVIGFPHDYKAFYPAWLRTRPVYLVYQGYTDQDFRIEPIPNDPTILRLLPK